MKRGYKLLILLLVLAVLVVAYVFAAKRTSVNNVGTESTPDFVAFSVEKSSINRISYTYKGEKVELIKRDGRWYDSSDETFPLNQSYPNEMTDTLSHIEAKRTISENGENKSDFGLDTAETVITFSVFDGSEYALNIGSLNRVADGCYINISSDSKIYLASSFVAEPFKYALLDMIQSDGLPNIESGSITKIEYIYRGEKRILEKDETGGDSAIVYNNVDISGNKTPSDSIKSAEFVSAVSRLSLDKCEAYRPSQDILNKYGLGDSRYLTLRMDYIRTVKSDNSSTSVEVKTDESITLNIGVYDGKYYCMTENSDILYSLKEETAKTFITSLEALAE